MANTSSNRSFGESIREARVAKNIGLRELAKKLTISPSYLSDIENDRRNPAEQVLSELARHLDLDFDNMMVRAGRLGDETFRYMTRMPAAGLLLRKLSTENAPENVIEELANILERKKKGRSRS
jgi:transcriptional regulator with XRE-family HTH domain